MRHLSRQTMTKIWSEFDRYAEEVRTSNLSDSSKRTYIEMARQFVYFMEGEFSPGVNTKQNRHAIKQM